MLAAKRFAVLNPIATTNFLPALNADSCNGCGKCAEFVPSRPWRSSQPATRTSPSAKKPASTNPSASAAASASAPAQAHQSSSTPAPARAHPRHHRHRAVLMAIERGKLQNLIFDNQAHWNHRAMAAILA